MNDAVRNKNGAAGGQQRFGGQQRQQFGYGYGQQQAYGLLLINS